MFLLGCLYLRTKSDNVNNYFGSWLWLTTVCFKLQEALAEVEEKYKQAMVQNAQLDNEKATLNYRVETMKDLLEEQDEELYRLRATHKATCQVNVFSYFALWQFKIHKSYNYLDQTEWLNIYYKILFYITLYFWFWL